MKFFLIGMIFGWITLPVIAIVYLRFGYTPVAVNGPSIPLEDLLAGTAVRARMAREAPKKAALPPSEENLAAGKQIYNDHCAACHGLPGQSKTPEAKGMYPPPPQFFEERQMGQNLAPEYYWTIANGIRLSGMPGYKGSLTETQMWQVAQFAANAKPETARSNNDFKRLAAKR
jgi:thiosulfate dehydrogenase